MYDMTVSEMQIGNEFVTVKLGFGFKDQDSFILVWKEYRNTAEGKVVWTEVLYSYEENERLNEIPTEVVRLLKQGLVIDATRWYRWYASVGLKEAMDQIKIWRKVLKQ